MSLSEYKKEKLKDLGLARGGAAFADQKAAATPTPTIVISLGGLGAQTLNMLKGKYLREIGQSDHIWFRMLDTDEYTFRNYSKNTQESGHNHPENANMEMAECIQLYDMSSRYILDPHMIPAYIDQWLNPSLKGREINELGAQMTRQIGRVMLMNDEIYQRVRNNLAQIINDAVNYAQGGEVNIILISGISGGTGSGMVIDLAYMIHDLMRELYFSNYNLAGYIFLPDAQFSTPAIASYSQMIANLKRNGYAALKEIDYFMNLEETDGRYRVRLRNGDVVSRKNIFSSCTLVSGFDEDGSLRGLNDLVASLTGYLLSVITDISIINRYMSKLQMNDVVSENVDAMVRIWFDRHPYRKLYHRYATYKYQILEYGSIRIPREEIFTYCADRIYERVLAEFKNNQNINGKMMKEIYSRTHIINPSEVTKYAIQVGDINRSLPIEGYTKSMMWDNPLIAYEDACYAAKSEAGKINSHLLTTLENSIYDNLKQQVDLIFDEYGPYAAVKAMQHKRKCLTDGDMNEPFSGVCEQLIRLSNAFGRKAVECMNSEGIDRIREFASQASSLFSSRNGLNAYIKECCIQAVTRYINSPLYHGLEMVFRNVSERMKRYCSEVLEEYTAILDEIQTILSQDAEHIVKDGAWTQDSIFQNPDCLEGCKYYLDDCISHVPVDSFARELLRSMRSDKEKWLAQADENNFDVVYILRDLMGKYLDQNELNAKGLEKFVVAAYHPFTLTRDEMEEIWGDDSADGVKMTALNKAAQFVITRLEDGATRMGHSSGRIPLNTYYSNYIFSGLTCTPNLTRILDEYVFAKYSTHVHQSRSLCNYIYAKQYYSLPLYILKGMDEYNEEYVKHPTAGRHMDEKGQDWGKMPNPYTIDSVALDLMVQGRDFAELNKYPDIPILNLIKKRTKTGLDLGAIRIEKSNLGATRIIILDIEEVPEDMETFKKKLKRTAWEAYHEEKEFDLISFMRERGFSLNPVTILAWDTDIDFELTDFRSASPEDMASKYDDIPVPVEDIYKWLRKNVKYMEILQRGEKIWAELQEIMSEATR